jgi:hypothetical protein
MKVFIDGLYRGDPRNYQDIKIKVNWEDKSSIEADVDSLEFFLEANTYIRQRMLDGMNGGVGLFEGIPITLESEGGVAFNGYLDLTDAELVGDEQVICKFTPEKGIDWLAEKAASFSYPYLESIGFITKADMVSVPYVRNYITNGTEIITVSISIFIIIKETAETVEALVKLVLFLSMNSLSPVLLLNTIIELVFLLIYLAIMVYAVIELTSQIVNNLYSPKRNHLGIKVRTLFQKSCEYLDLGYESSLLDSEWGDRVIIPAKTKKGGSRGETGVPDSVGAITSFEDLIVVFKAMYNADYRIENGVFKFEQVNSNTLDSTYVVPDSLNDQERLLDRYTPNGFEIKSNIILSYSYDTMDVNTLTETEGMVYQVITSPKQVVNKENVTLKGLDSVAIPFALATTKTKLSPIEQYLELLAKITDVLTSILGKKSKFSKKVQNRVGVMNLSDDIITVPKLVQMAGKNLAANQRVIMSAKRLWDNLHVTKSFVDVDGQHNQWMIDKPRRVQMNPQEFASLLKSRYCTTANGMEARVDSLEWMDYNNTAEIVVRVRQKYTDNLKLEYVE